MNFDWFWEIMKLIGLFVCGVGFIFFMIKLKEIWISLLNKFLGGK